MKEKIQEIAAANLRALAANLYPGRGIVVGMEEKSGAIVQLYWIMGRSDSSRNRIFTETDGKVMTDYADPSKVKGDASLIIYQAMGYVAIGQPASYIHVVSNGHQTETVLEMFEDEITENLAYTLADWSYEPDAPNYTPRITAEAGYFPGQTPYFQMVLLRKSMLSDACERFLFNFGGFYPGIGHCLTTYLGDGNPLPSFQGEPYPLPLKGNIDELAETFWAALNGDNRVSLAVKFIYPDGNFQTKIINKYETVR